jgi:hypothetical protein
MEKSKIKNQISKIRKFLNFDFCILLFDICPSDGAAVAQAVQRHCHDNNHPCNNLLNPVRQVYVCTPGSYNCHN